MDISYILHVVWNHRFNCMSRRWTCSELYYRWGPVTRESFQTINEFTYYIIHARLLFPLMFSVLNVLSSINLCSFMHAHNLHTSKKRERESVLISNCLNALCVRSPFALLPIDIVLPKAQQGSPISRPCLLSEYNLCNMSSVLHFFVANELVFATKPKINVSMFIFLFFQ